MNLLPIAWCGDSVNRITMRDFVLDMFVLHRTASVFLHDQVEDAGRHANNEAALSAGRVEVGPDLDAVVI